MSKRPVVITLECRFYATEGGAEPVRDWLKSLPAGARYEIGSDIERVQFRWPVSRPLVGSLGGGLYEVRTTHNKTEYRVFFVVDGRTMVLLHAFQKKTQKTPASELEIARKRRKELGN
jgi:phage-related protein